MTIRIGFLGPTLVAVDGDEAPIGAARQRAVLARLAIDVGTPVSVDQLLNDVWADDLPAGRAKALAYQITKLRDLLEPQRTGPGSIIVTAAAGYMLALERDDVDIHRFRRLLDDALSARDRVSRVLDAAFEWIKGHLRATAIGLFAGFGLIFLIKGPSTLAG